MPVFEDCSTDKLRNIVLVVVAKGRNVGMVFCFEVGIEGVKILVSSIEESFECFFSKGVQVLTGDIVETFVSINVSFYDRTLNASTQSEEVCDSFIVIGTDIAQLRKICTIGEISQMVEEFMSEHVHTEEFAILFITEDCASNMYGGSIDDLEKIFIGGTCVQIERNVLNCFDKGFFVTKHVRVIDVLDNVISCSFDNFELIFRKLSELGLIVDAFVRACFTYKRAALEELFIFVVFDFDTIGRDIIEFVGIFHDNVIQGVDGIKIEVRIFGVLFSIVKESFLEIDFGIGSGDFGFGSMHKYASECADARESGNKNQPQMLFGKASASVFLGLGSNGLFGVRALFGFCHCNTSFLLNQLWRIGLVGKWSELSTLLSVRK